MPEIRDVLERESRTVDLERGDFERLLGRRERRNRNRRIRAGALGVVVTLALGSFFARSLMSADVPADRPVPTPGLTGVSGALVYALDGDIYVADPDGSNAVRIADATTVEGCQGSAAFSTPAWSPDGRYLAFQRECLGSAQAGVVITGPDGDVIAEFPTDGWGLTWSPDSMRIAVWERRADRIGVYGIDGERQASLRVPPVPGGGSDAAPGWMPDGSALLLWGYLVVPLDGGAGYDLSLGDQATYSPDGTRVAVVEGNSITVYDADGSTVSEVEGLSGVDAWSPDGERFASVSRRFELVVVDATSGQVTVVTETVTGVRGFSPQGDRILYTVGARDGGGFSNDLYSIGVDGSDARLLVVEAMDGQWRPR
jgi:Tol biopolymer transport system component